MDAPKQGADALFILLGAIMVLAMHAGFAFLELGTVRKKNQVNALVKILVDFSLSTVVYFMVGYGVAYGTHFMVSAEELAARNGYELVKFFFLLTFAAAIPAIVSGGIAERARFYPQLLATAVIVGFVYPFFEGIAWNQHFGFQAWLKASTGEEFHDFAGSVVVHAMGGWLAIVAVVLLGARTGRYPKSGGVTAQPPSSIPFLALGAWILAVGWFGFNVMSAQTIDKISGLVAVNSLMAMAGGTIAALILGRNDPGFVHNGPLAGLVAVLAAVVVLAGQLRAEGIDLQHLDMGGGLGISYDGQPTISIESYVQTLVDAIRPTRLPIVVEPGRSIVGPSGVLVGRVVDLKPRNALSTFAVLDVGMTEIMRPALYGAFHVLRRFQTGQPVAGLRVLAAPQARGAGLALPPPDVLRVRMVCIWLPS